MTLPADLDDLSDEPAEDVLPTFAVLARFAEQAPDGETAVRQVMTRLGEAEEPFHEVRVERQEDATTWMVVARFVMVSVDAGTAVAGVSETLTDAGLRPDEVWAGPRVS